MHALSRRKLLARGAAAGLLLGNAPLPRALGKFAGGTPYATKRVIFVAFAGGIRTRETLGTPANTPNLTSMAEEGVVYPQTRTANLGHFGASLALFTGVSEARGIRENARGPHPTLFEYARRELNLEGGDVWVTTSGGAQQVNYSYSTHPDYGARFGANTIDGDGVFNAEFKQLIDRYGRPRALEPAESKLLTKLRMRLAARRGEAGGVNSAESAERLERYILAELTKGTVRLTGPNAADAKAMQVGSSVLAIFRPTLIGIVLRNADIAHGSYNGYVEVIRKNDEALGALWRLVKSDPELADSTAIFVVPEFGRDSDLNSRRGLDHGDGSDDLRVVSTVCWGPDFARGRVVRSPIRTIDVCSSVCAMLGAGAPYARGTRLPKLFA